MKPHVKIHIGDVRKNLAGLEDGSVHCCVTSPPYWGLRSYLPDDSPLKEYEMGSEKTPEEWCERQVEVFREVWRVLRDDGTLWLNVGDCYAAGGWECRRRNVIAEGSMPAEARKSPLDTSAYKPGDRIQQGAMLSEALRRDGWYLRQVIVWAKAISFNRFEREAVQTSLFPDQDLAEEETFDSPGSCMPESANGWRWERCRVRRKKVGNKALREVPERTPPGGVQLRLNTKQIPRSLQEMRECLSQSISPDEEGEEGSEAIREQAGKDEGAPGKAKAIPADRAGKKGKKAKRQAIRKGRSGPESQEEVSAISAGASQAGQGPDKEKDFAVNARGGTDSGGVGGNQDSLPEQVRLLRAAGKADNGPRCTPVEGREASSEQHRPGLPDLQLEEGESEWVDCPGCSRCIDTGGFVLRKGNWRPTNSWEYLYQLTKGDSFGDREAVAEKSTGQKGSAADFCREKEGPLPPGQAQPSRRRDRDHTADSGTRNLRSVWRIATKGYPGAHYATFPVELPVVCIKASTSWRGVCPECGAPSARVVDVGRSHESGSGKSGRPPSGKQATALQGGGATGDVRNGPCVSTSTVGWRATCSHEAEPIPATVLDPYGGSGTTAEAAVLLGRSAVVIDLDPRNERLIRKRLRRVGLACEVRTQDGKAT